MYNMHAYTFESHKHINFSGFAKAHPVCRMLMFIIMHTHALLLVDFYLVVQYSIIHSKISMDSNFVVFVYT